MSATTPPTGPSSSGTPVPGSPDAKEGAAGDPSMEDILASIRRILSDDEAEQASTPASASLGPIMPAPAQLPPPRAPDVLALDARMIVDESRGPAPAPREATAKPAPEGRESPSREPGSKPVLVAPEAAAAAASSVGNLLRTLGTSREPVAIYRGGPTLEDMVREELRPLLKQWLDDQLPKMVERLVRAEIERVVGRAGG